MYILQPLIIIFLLFLSPDHYCLSVFSSAVAWAGRAFALVGAPDAPIFVERKQNLVRGGGTKANFFFSFFFSKQTLRSLLGQTTTPQTVTVLMT